MKKQFMYIVVAVVMIAYLSTSAYAAFVYMPEDYQIPTAAPTSFKAWMPHTSITVQGSDQYIMQKLAYTDKNGFRRIGDDYMVAMGTYYATECGARFEIQLDSDVTFTVVVSDIKQPAHTDESNMYSAVKDKNGELIFCNVLEFIVDKKTMDEVVLSTGSVSDLNLVGNITKVTKIGEMCIEQCNDCEYCVR